MAVVPAFTFDLNFLFLTLSENVSGLLELRRHRWIPLGEFLNREILGFVVGKPEIVLRAQEGIFCLLKVIDGLVNLIDGGFELLRGQFVIPRETLFEGL